MEDYDDERDDPKYYKSGQLFKRRRDYDTERQEDVRDRQREKEETEELRKKLLAEGCKDPEEEMARLASEAEAKLLRKLRAESDEPPTPRRKAKERQEDKKAAKAARKKARAEGQPVEEGLSSTSDSSEEEEDSDPGGWGKDLMETEEKDGGTPASVPTPAAPGPGQEPNLAASSAPKMGFQALKIAPGVSGVSGLPGAGDGGTAAAQSLAARIAAFGAEEEEEDGAGSSKSKLTFSVTAEERRANLTPGERQKMQKELIGRIPTGKTELFAFPIGWEEVDQGLIDKRVRPWVNKKILEYIGEEEPSLVDFICAKIRDKDKPDNILNDIKMVLDEEADTFVVKLWRLLIYELEAKKLGIAKD